MGDSIRVSASGIVIKENKVLLVRQAYGPAKGLLIIPGGYLKDGEMPDVGLEREVFEETKIVAKTKSLIAIRFTPKNWWGIFSAEYVSGEATPDDYETTEAFFIGIKEALSREDLTYTTREVLKVYNEESAMKKSDFCLEGLTFDEYQLYLENPQEK